ncbi:twin-arginine translocation signal domain-containing protein [Thermogemmatispora sp.]|uniref:twin-arginine translocation signal domain-containing protein n=1 Tax=Thermogemmatispora sp. TaxID=1968838 RepID=UPI0035E45C97
MPRITRRTFLKRTTIGMAAGGTLVGTLEGAGPSAARSLPVDLPTTGEAVGYQPVSASDSEEPLVLHVRQRSTGEVSILTGTREITYRDPGLVAHLLKKTGRP